MKLYVQKSTDVLFATLQAFGVAEFLQVLGGSDGKQEIQVSDIGHAFEISTSLAIEEICRRIQTCDIPNLMPAIVPLHRISAGKRYGDLERYLPSDFRGDIVYFDKEADKHEQFDADKLYPIWRYISHSHGIGNAVLKVYPALIHIWATHLQQKPTQIALLETIFKLFSFSEEKPEAEQYWLVNVKPQLGYQNFRQFKWHKNESKLSALSIVSPCTITGNESDSAHYGIQIHLPQFFWLELYFAFLGLTLVGLPFEVGSDDLLIAYPNFKHLDFALYKQVVDEYRQSKLYKTIWMKAGDSNNKHIEILMFLSTSLISSPSSDFSLKFLAYTKLKMHYPSGESLIASESGLSAAFSDKKIVREFLDIAFSLSKETQTAISSLYRAIVGNHFEDWLAFFLDFQASNDPLSWDHLNQIIINTGDFQMNGKRNYAEIWSDRGFRRMAKAIYFVTLRAEYFKSQDYETSLKPWYDLKNDLLQSSANPDCFLERLFRFVIDYQETTSRIKANSREYFPRLPIASHIAVSKLVAEFGSRLIAHALIASAYSIRGKKSTEEIDLKIDVSKLIAEFGSDAVARALNATAHSIRSKKSVQDVEPKNEE